MFNNEIKEIFKEIYQSRSRFQIEKFVVGQHYSPEMQYYQLCLEISGLLDIIEEEALRIEKIKAEIEELKESGKKSDFVEAKIKEKSIEQTESKMLGSQKELGIMKEIFEKYPKYTREEIEAAQPKYWEERLTRVAQLQFLGAKVGVNWAQFEAIHQAGIFPEAIEALPTMNYLENEQQNLLTQGYKRVDGYEDILKSSDKVE